MTARKNWDLDAPYAMGKGDYELFVKSIKSDSVRRILELGSGSSTCQLAQDFTCAKILSLESNNEYAQKTNALLESESINNAEVIFSPIRPLWFKGGAFLTYSKHSLSNTLKFDVMLVDGPVERIYSCGREAGLYAFFDLLSVGCVIGLDDYHRDSARKSVNNWLEVFGSGLKVVHQSESFIVLLKVKEISVKKIDRRMRIHSYKCLARDLLKILKQCGSHIRSYIK